MTVRLIHPLVTAFVFKLPQTLGIILLSIILTGFLSDAIITVCAIIHIRNKLILTERISADMRKLSDAAGERIFGGVEYVLEKKTELENKNSERRQKLEELTAKYKKLSEERDITLKRLSKAFPKLSFDRRNDIKERLEKLKEEIMRK